MPPVLLFNPEPQVERIQLANGQCCHVVDDVLLQPELLVEWAVQQRAQFRAVDFNAYPGQYLLLPSAIEEALQTFFVSHVRGLFDARRLLQMQCRLAMVTLPPQALRPAQWFCHADRFGLEPLQSIQASVLYLFKDEALGGTSFYEATHSPQVTQQLFADSSSLPPHAFSERYGIQPGYMHASNDYFRQIGHVPARWNRAIFYDGGIYHSGHIESPEKLSDDPLAGRLTLNGFFTCRRHCV